MQILSDAHPFRLPAAVIAIGMFDGVHRGHRRVLGQLRDVGRERGLPTVLVTFDPHPRALLRPESTPPLLSSLADRMELLAATDALDYCVVLSFDQRRSEESAEDFVRGTLVARLGMRALVVGENFVCGRGRSGNVATLRALGAGLGFSMHPVALRSAAESQALDPCSSSRTRRLI